jgi:PAS domain S-box-containing protein
VHQSAEILEARDRQREETMVTTVHPVYGGLLERTYDHIPVAVVRIGTDRAIVYANQVAKELLGSNSLVGTDFIKLVSEAHVGRLEAELRRRFDELEGSNYEIELEPPGRARRIPVTISAAPEFGSDGELVGSIAFMRDLSFEKANDTIREAIESEKSPADILKTCETVLKVLIPHDCFRVTVVSRNRKHLRISCEHPPLTLGYNALKCVADAAFRNEVPAAQRRLRPRS